MIAQLLMSVALAGGATHLGNVTADGVDWSSRYHLEQTSVALAVPMPAGTSVSGATAERDKAGRIVTLDFDMQKYGDVVMSVPGTESGILRPPLAAGRDPQRVILAGGFVPDPSIELSKHIRYWSHEDVSRADRTALDRFGGRARIQDQALYVVADNALVEAGGIRGERVAAKSRNRRVIWGIGLLFVAILLGMGMLYRALETLAKHERNEDYIRRHLSPSETPPLDAPDGPGSLG